MRLLIWHWGRNGAGPRYAASLADAFRDYTQVVPLLSLPDNAEILSSGKAPVMALPVRTYRSLLGFGFRAITAPFRILPLAWRIKRLRPDLALCAMPAMLDLLMAASLRSVGIPFAVIVHDATAHLGERVPLQHRLQRFLLRQASIIITLTDPVAASLRTQGLTDGKIVLSTVLPALVYGDIAPPIAHGGKLRLLCFGRLLPYKGLDLLAEAWAQLAPADMELRVVGQGPEGTFLDRLRALPNVQVDNRWVPEAEMTTLLGWPDAVILPYREASQSGVAAAAIAAGRRVVSTNVGGLADQLGHEPAAILCEPDATALSHAIARLRQPAEAGSTASPSEAWRNMAERLAHDLHQAILIRNGHII